METEITATSMVHFLTLLMKQKIILSKYLMKNCHTSKRRSLRSFPAENGIVVIREAQIMRLGLPPCTCAAGNHLVSLYFPSGPFKSK